MANDKNNASEIMVIENKDAAEAVAKGLKERLRVPGVACRKLKGEEAWAILAAVDEKSAAMISEVCELALDLYDLGLNTDDGQAPDTDDASEYDDDASDDAESAFAWVGRVVDTVAKGPKAKKPAARRRGK